MHVQERIRNVATFVATFVPQGGQNYRAVPTRKVPGSSKNKPPSGVSVPGMPNALSEC
jgi:hypothetical protein